jgi:crotonobetainyl-CoA:carnitine CoA-transferase CaiB-like acyl-CoA transferase
MSETPPLAARRAPLLGEHTREVLREAGCSDAEISQLLASGSPGGRTLDVEGSGGI